MMNKISRAGKVAHDLGLSTWFGGTLFGQVALNPTVSSISDRRERGRVLNESWGRFNAVNAPALAAALLAWRLGGLRDDAELRAPALARVKDFLLGPPARRGGGERGRLGHPGGQDRQTVLRGRDARRVRNRACARDPGRGGELSAYDLLLRHRLPRPA